MLVSFGFEFRNGHLILAAGTLLCMLEGLFGDWIGVLESLKVPTLVANVR